MSIDLHMNEVFPPKVGLSASDKSINYGQPT